VKTVKEDLKIVAPNNAVTASLVAQVKRGLPAATKENTKKKIQIEGPDNKIGTMRKLFNLVFKTSPAMDGHISGTMRKPFEFSFQNIRQN